MHKKIVYILLICFVPLFTFAQVLKKSNSNKSTLNQYSSKRSSSVSNQSSTKVSDSIATIDMYKIISIDRDTTYVDTSLTISQHYKANYLRKDLFGLLPFNNIGHTYNTLDYGLTDYNPFPEFGFKAKHFPYIEVEDIKYYNVATPYTDLFYKSVLEQGQILDASIAVNTSKNLSFAIGYKGIRSVGKYINSITSNGNFRFITSYNTTDRRYKLKLHFTGQDFSNGENGGIVNLQNFESGVSPYDERGRLEVFLNDAKSILKGNRYFIDHSFKLKKEAVNNLVIKHRFTYENKFFEYNQPTITEYFGDAYTTSSVRDKTRYNKMYNKVGVAYSNKNIGDLEFYLEDYNYNYYYNRVVLDSVGDIKIPNSLSDRINTYGVSYTYEIGKWRAKALLSNSITNQSLANIDVSAKYKLNNKNQFSFRYQKMNKLPDLNYRLYQSDFIDYNWYEEDLKNEKINNFEIEANTQWLALSAKYTVLNDLLYFSNTSGEVNEYSVESLLKVEPKQYDGTINYFSVKARKEFKYWNFALDNTVLYQNVEQGSNILNVPQLVTRNTLYYSDYFFKKALYLQTGFTLNYFTDYYANNYNPLVGEFYIQNNRKIGGYPLMDFFINAKIDQFRVFIKAEHFNTMFTNTADYYSAPNYPYRDFTFRLGVIWVFFT
ncbi:hypothetical protein GCM10007424_15070 [Flavobacterium suaedae]|uniref:Porin n=1 Tax=Flavobacterium suaedae TaxID=1767027 RepID=A0ABQ1JW81_9FLAO|nr:putative porin [Flavobacterium suaedae]GGB76076.1 hypothetical protein GCM10007424_15070 [Flavobacterium suaedae]